MMRHKNGSHLSDILILHTLQKVDSIRLSDITQIVCVKWGVSYKLSSFVIQSTIPPL